MYSSWFATFLHCTRTMMILVIIPGGEWLLTYFLLFSQYPLQHGRYVSYFCLRWDPAFQSFEILKDHYSGCSRWYAVIGRKRQRDMAVIMKGVIVVVASGLLQHLGLSQQILIWWETSYLISLIYGAVDLKFGVIARIINIKKSPTADADLNFPLHRTSWVTHSIHMISFPLEGTIRHIISLELGEYTIGMSHRQVLPSEALFIVHCKTEVVQCMVCWSINNALERMSGYHIGVMNLPPEHELV